MSISSTTVRTFRGRVCQAFRRLFSSVRRGVWQALIIATGTLELTNSRFNITVREMCGCFATARLATRWLHCAGSVPQGGLHLLLHDPTEERHRDCRWKPRMANGSVITGRKGGP